MLRRIGFRSSLMVAAAAAALAPPAVAQDAEDLRQLIELQRQQLETQQQQLEAMERRLEELEQDSFREEFLEGIEPPTPPVIAEGARVTSGETGIDLAISGQVNRMVTLADDGDKTKLYNVDNDNSSSRIRFVGRGRTDGGLVVGSLIEAQIQPNDSETVNRRNQDTGNVSFESRHVDLFVQHEEFGKVSLGRGDTASNNTAEVDLSGTTVIAYSSISDTAGGLLFYDDDTNALSDTQINDAYSNLDGLSRRDRLRYDTPTLAGFTLSADVISSARYSAGLTWAGQLPDWQMAAAAGYSYPGGGSDYIIDGSASVLHLPTGLNATVSAGQEARDDQDDAGNIYVKLGWKRAFFSFGETAMSIDYAHNTDLDQDGDDFDTVGLFAVQAIETFGVEFYGGYRFHSLDRNDADFDDIHTVSIGSRIKF